MPTSFKTLRNAYDIGKKAGLKFVYIGNTPALKKESTHCHACGTLLIKREGYFLTFVHYNNGLCKNCGCEMPGVLT